MTETFHAGPGLGRLSDVTIIHGDCIEAMAELPADSVDAIVTDPPYGLEFMGKAWDSFAPQNTTAQRSNAGGFGDDETKPWNKARSGTKGVRTTFRCRSCNGWSGSFSEARASRQKECKCDSPDLNYAGAPPQTVAFGKWCELWTTEALRVLKPGGHLLAFGGTRTWHRLAVAVEDAGFEIRDSIAWLYGSGFPKSLDVSKAIDKARDDKPDVLAVTSRLADLAAAAGITRQALDAEMGTSDMGGWWLSRLPHRCACPSVDNWSRLRGIIPGATELDAEVWRLNGRKGSYGEAWQSAEVVGSASVPVGHSFAGSTYGGDSSNRVVDLKAPATPEAEQWSGFGTALKPAFEPVVVARKPLVGTVAANVLAHGTGALNVDGCRIGTEGGGGNGLGSRMAGVGNSIGGVQYATDPRKPCALHGIRNCTICIPSTGRWPANVCLDADQAAALDQMSGTRAAGNRPKVRNADENRTAYGDFAGQAELVGERLDSGGASRFFLNVPLDDVEARFKYCAKAPKKERPVVIDADGKSHSHATVKPLALMRWLVRLVTPPGGTILDPFAGSGTTVEAALLEDFRVIGIEREADYLPMIQQRIARSLDV